MREGKTSTGFSYKFDEQRLDDMRFVEVLSVVIDDKSSILDKLTGTSRLITMLLGEEQKEALYQHIEKQHGRVPRAELEKALEEIMNTAGEESEKNS